MPLDIRYRRRRVHSIGCRLRSIAEIAGLCQREWGTTRVRDVIRLPASPGSAGLYRVTTEDGDFLVTLHRRHRSRSEMEQAASAATLLARRGIPTPTYRRTEDGSVVADEGGTLITLRSWLPGDTIQRESLGPHQMALLGRTLGRCHSILSGLPHGHVVAWPTQVSDAIEETGTLTARIGARAGPADADRQVLNVLATKRALLEHAPDLAAAFGSFPAQVVHGDYYVDNVLVDEDGSLTGVIDVDGRVDYRVWEVYYAI